MIIAIIDNYDSFTYNLVQYVAMGGGHPVVFGNDRPLAEIGACDPQGLLLSPGPGTVEDPRSCGVSLGAIEHFLGRIPILGVCLGHQAVAKAVGGKIRRTGIVRHGRVSTLRRLERRSPLLRGIPRRFRAMRYHSLVVDPDTLPPSLTTVCVSEDDGEIMAIEDRSRHLFGVQFHPESVGTRHGLRIIENFIHLARSTPRSIP